MVNVQPIANAGIYHNLLFWFDLLTESNVVIYRKDAVKISMDTFIKRFQPENYVKWRSGNDIGPHPEDFHRSLSDT